MKIITLLTLLLTASVVTAADKPVHLFILSGQSNMVRMNPNAGFMPEAGKLFKDEEVLYIKVSKGSQPICRWLEEWVDIAKKNGLDSVHSDPSYSYAVIPLHTNSSDNHSIAWQIRSVPAPRLNPLIPSNEKRKR